MLIQKAVAVGLICRKWVKMSASRYTPYKNVVTFSPVATPRRLSSGKICGLTSAGILITVQSGQSDGCVVVVVVHCVSEKSM